MFLMHHNIRSILVRRDYAHHNNIQRIFILFLQQNCGRLSPMSSGDTSFVFVVIGYVSSLRSKTCTTRYARWHLAWVLIIFLGKIQ
jgi:hypothetical protein